MIATILSKENIDYYILYDSEINSDNEIAVTVTVTESNNDCGTDNDNDSDNNRIIIIFNNNDNNNILTGKLHPLKTIFRGGPVYKIYNSI